LAQADCVAKAVKRRAFARALRAEVDGSEAEALSMRPCEHARMGTADSAAPGEQVRANKERD